MKIIDLLNKGANGEELPQKFRYDNYIFTLNDFGMYIDGDCDYITSHICHDLSNLNDEIEIIKEEKDIKKLDKRKFYDNRFPDDWEEELINKIDELINVVNELKNK